jgi:hypothetical protein
MLKCIFKSIIIAFVLHFAIQKYDGQNIQKYNFDWFLWVGNLVSHIQRET